MNIITYIKRAFIGVGLFVCLSEHGCFAAQNHLHQQGYFTAHDGTVVNVPTEGNMVAVTPDGQFSYAILANSDTVIPTNLATHIPSFPIAVGVDPFAISIVGDVAYVFNGGDGTVSPIDLATNTVGPAIVWEQGHNEVEINPVVVPAVVQHMQDNAQGAPIIPTVIPNPEPDDQDHAE